MSFRLTGTWAQNLVAFVLFVLLALVSTWPLAQFPASRLPMGTEEAWSVPYLNLWTVTWNVKSLSEGSFFGSAYWNAPIFWPELDSLAMSEAQPITAICAPIFWITGSAVVTYNFYFWISLTLNGWVVWCVLRQRGHRILPAACTACAMLLLPIVHWQAGVLQLVPIWAFILAIHRLGKLIESTDRSKSALTSQDPTNPETSAKPGKIAFRSSLVLSVAIALAFWISVHQGLLLSVLITFVSVASLFIYRRKALIQSYILAAIFAIALISPLIWKHRQVSQRHDFHRDHETVQGLSAELADYGMTYGRTIGDNDPQRRPWFLGIGLGKTVLALGGCGLMFSNRRRWILLWGAIAAASFALSFGTNLQLGDLNIWDSLTRITPGLAQVRSVYRFAFFVQIAAVFLGAELLDYCLSWLESCKKRIAKISLSFLVGCCLLIFVFEAVPREMKLVVIPEANEKWVETLDAIPAGPVIILPMTIEGNVRDYERTTEWMVQLNNKKYPLVNGYSGYFPESFNALAQQIEASGMSAGLISLLHGKGVKYVVRQPYYSQKPGEDWNQLHELTESGSQVRVFEIPDPTLSK